MGWRRVAQVVRRASQSVNVSCAGAFDNSMLVAFQPGGDFSQRDPMYAPIRTDIGWLDELPTMKMPHGGRWRIRSVRVTGHLQMAAPIMLRLVDAAACAIADKILRRSVPSVIHLDISCHAKHFTPRTKILETSIRLRVRMNGFGSKAHRYIRKNDNS